MATQEFVSAVLRVVKIMFKVLGWEFNFLSEPLGKNVLSGPEAFREALATSYACAD